MKSAGISAFLNGDKLPKTKRDRLVSMSAPVKNNNTVIPAFPSLDNPKKPSPADKSAIVAFYTQIKCHVPLSTSLDLISGGMGISLTKGKLMAWQRKFVEGGSSALHDKRGGNNIVADDLIIRDVLASHPGRGLGNLYEIYRLRWLQANPGNQYDNIQYSGFVKAASRVLKSDEATRIMHVKGLDALMSNVHTARRRDITRINQEWQIDATTHDMMVLAPVIADRQHPGFATGIPYRKWHSYKYDQKISWGQWTDHYRVIYAPKRKTIVAITDVYSGRRVWGTFDSASSYADVRLLVKAIKQLGKPRTLRIDNGADYLSRHFQGVCGRLGIITIKARPFKGKDKGVVERNFRTMQHGRMELLSGFAGHNVAERQLLEASALTKDERLTGVQTHLKNLFTEEEAGLLIDHFIKTEGERLGWNARWKEQYGLYGTDRIPDDILDVSAGQRHQRQVSRTGVNIKGKEYDHPILYKYQDEKLVIAEDINDISRVFVLHPEDERIICVAYDTRMRHFTSEEYRRIEKAHTKHYRTLRRAAERVRLEDADLIEKHFVGDILDAERKRKAELLRGNRGTPTDEMEVITEKTGGNVLLLQRAKEHLARKTAQQNNDKSNLLKMVRGGAT